MVAIDLLARVAESDSFINLLLPSFLSKAQVPDSDRGLIQELSYGTLRWQLQYDTFIDHFTVGKTLSPKLRIAIRLGMHQLFRMRIPAHAAIHETVELVKVFERSAAGMSNAVLRNADRVGFDQLLAECIEGKRLEELLAIRYSHPTWVISALRSALELDGKQDQLEQLLEANNETPTVNLAALPNTNAAQFLESAGLERGAAAPTAFMAQGNPENYLTTDGVRVQDQGSQLVALALLEVADKSGRWLDMCSGPGGKAAMLQAGISASGGVLDCLEPIPNRADLVRQALNKNLPGNVKVGYGQDAKADFYDAVLLDAPCSGLGSVRRKPESRWRKTPEQLSGLTKTQAELLVAASRALKSGGHLLYSTCSPLVIETNTQIKQVLEQHPELELVNANEVLNRISPSLGMSTNRKTAQLWTHLHATDAMFIAILRKK
ncbi:MAG: hypothetical protein RI929_545 [Actinomycetota bacterium]|jgi:16S rRNA (cytosine967-C5)-methyltransferase